MSAKAVFLRLCSLRKTENRFAQTELQFATFNSTRQNIFSSTLSVFIESFSHLADIEDFCRQDGPGDNQIVGGDSWK